MKDKGKKNVRAAVICGILSTVWFVLAVCNRQAGHTVFSFPEFVKEEGYSEEHVMGSSSMEDRAALQYTSTGYRYPQQFEEVLEHYDSFRKLYHKELNVAVPGLAYTRLTNSASSQMVPQGICLAGEYMLLTAYDREGGSNSVMYVLKEGVDGERRLLTVLELPEKNHAGGIAYDGTYVWIARSTTGYLGAISYETVQKAAASGQKSVRLTAYDQNIPVGVTASFVTYYKERLWVGTFRSVLDGPGSLSSYRVEGAGEELRLRREATMKIPSYVQGALFLSQDGGVCLILAASSGRYMDSKIYFYRFSDPGGVPTIRLLDQYRFPPMVETLASDGRNTYFLFESAATCYSTLRYQKCVYPVDRVFGIPNRSLLCGILP